MGLFGITILYPVGGRPPVAQRLETVGRDILRGFERLDVLVPGTSDNVKANRDPASISHLTRADPDASLSLVHFAVDATLLRPALGDLIFTMTQAEWADGLDFPDFNSPELLALPLLDVTVLSKRIRAINGPDGSLACRSWAMIEFSYEGIKFHEEVNYIRQEEHPLFGELGEVLNSDIGWTVLVH